MSKKPNEAQKLLESLGVPAWGPIKGRSKTSTKKGPGRVHAQGYARKNKRYYSPSAHSDQGLI